MRRGVEEEGRRAGRGYLGCCGIGIGIFGEGWDVVWWTDWVSGLGLLMGWDEMGGWMGGWDVGQQCWYEITRDCEGFFSPFM